MLSSLLLVACGPTRPPACRLYPINNILRVPVVYHVLITEDRTPLNVFVPPGLSCVVDRGKPDQRSMINYIKLHQTPAVLECL